MLGAFLVTADQDLEQRLIRSTSDDYNNDDDAGDDDDDDDDDDDGDENDYINHDKVDQ